MTNTDIMNLSNAESFASLSLHPTVKVGAIIVDRHKKIISTGVNCLPVRSDMSKIAERHTIHAELSAILSALGRNFIYLSRCTLYCTHPPCSRCCAVIAHVGFITRVVAIQGTDEYNEKWGKDCQEGQKILAECNVIYEESFRI